MPARSDVHPYPPHLPTFDYRGPQRYFLTSCTDDRRPLVTVPAHVDLVALYFLQVANECGFADLAHCFMPDHLQAVVEGRREDADLRIFVARTNQFTGFHFKKTFG